MDQPLTSKQKHELKRFVRQLADQKGNHTELVSVYVPQGYDLTKVISHLQQEQGTATNIKSTATRKNVIDALEKMIQHLKLIEKTPENGLAVFSGDISDREGQSNVKVFSVEPPVALNIRIYRCDKQFVTEPLEEMLAFDNVYGLVVIDRRDGCIATLKGTRIQVLLKTHSEVPGKTRAGGQSAPRFARLREGATKDHYKKVAQYMTDTLLPIKELKGILVGGPGVTVNDFVNKEYITGDLQRKIIAIKDLSYTDEFGLKELVDKSQDVLASEALAIEKKAMGDFFKFLATDDTKVTYGLEQVKKALSMGAVDKLLVSESLGEHAIDELEEECEQYKAECIIVSTQTQEGEQLRDIGKIAAILRFQVS
ncbi:MAG: peptide chain release factor aRF-1 [Candidatus Woesearchaeota archaeon]